MKNKIAILSLSALALAPLAQTPALAGDHEWATVGKILTGVAVVHAISHAFPPPVFVSTPPWAIPKVRVVPVAPVCVQPAPVVLVSRPVCLPAPVHFAPPVCVPRFCPPPFPHSGVGLRVVHHPHPHWRY